MSCEVEVPTVSTAVPPSVPESETAEDVCTETTVPVPSPTYEWFCGLPIAASAGSAFSNFYEASKNYNTVTQYTLGTVEGSVKKAASVVAPVIHKLDGPIQAVDSYTASKLTTLGDKVPSLKSEPEDVTRYISETKESLVTKIGDGKAAVYGSLSSGKDAVSSRMCAGAEAVANSRAGVLCGEGKKAAASYYNQGKEAISTKVAAGRDAMYSTVQYGAETIANTRAGILVGAGVNRTLEATESLVDYLVPEMENEKELFSEFEKEEKRVAGLPLTRQPRETKGEKSDEDPEKEEESEEMGSEESEKMDSEESRIDRVYKISRKMRLRMFYCAMYRLQGAQQSCRSTLDQLKVTVDLLKMVQAARDGLDHRYQSLTGSLKDWEGQLKQLLTRKTANTDDDMCAEEEEDNTVPWLNPPRGTLQASLDYAKQLSEKAYNSLGSVTVASRFLPGNLRENAGLAYERAQNMYSTLKPVQSPVDLSASALTKLSSVLETQLGYIRQLGTYLSSILYRDVPVKDPESDDVEEKEEEGTVSEDTEFEIVSKVESDEN